MLQLGLCKEEIVEIPSFALYLEYISSDLGRLAKSEGQYFLRIFILVDISEIDAPDNFDKRENLPNIHADKSFFITPKHTRCMYSNGTCETIPIGRFDNGLLPSL